MSIKRRTVLRNHLCENCRRPFKSSRAHARTCSARCRMALSRAGQKKKKKSETDVTIQQLEFLLRKYGAN